MSHKVSIFSECDGWLIEVQGDKYIHRWSWAHDDFDSGAGGEKLFGDILKSLGFEVTMEDVY